VFDFNLIKKFGWYNFKTNPKGISRDHIVSINYGFKNKIDPKIISHPANCNLLQHNLNISKYTKNGMTIEELKKKIENWENDYCSLKYSR
jgi:hypothetical protein